LSSELKDKIEFISNAIDAARANIKQADVIVLLAQKRLNDSKIELSELEKEKSKLEALLIKNVVESNDSMNIAAKDNENSNSLDS
jgi:hypothetical protein